MNTNTQDNQLLNYSTAYRILQALRLLYLQFRKSNGECQNLLRDFVTPCVYTLCLKTCLTWLVMDSETLMVILHNTLLTQDHIHAPTTSDDFENLNWSTQTDNQDYDADGTQQFV